MFGKSLTRSRWAAIGAAVAVTLGAGGIGISNATISSGERAVFVAITPCRLFDTRPTSAVGPRTTPLGPGEIFTQSVWGTNGNCTIPADAVAVAMNVTAINGTAASYLTIWPSDVAQPLVSSLNWIAGSPPTPNKVDVRLSAAGQINLFNNLGSVHVLADVVGYYVDHNFDDRYYTKAAIDLALLRRQTFVGYVSGTGVKEGTGSYTSGHSSTGVYSVSYDFTGQGIPAAYAPMVIVASPSGFCSTGAAAADWSTFSSASGNLTTMSFTIDTTNAVGLADCGFSFIATFAGSDTLVIPVASVASISAASRVAAVPGGDITCVNKNGTAVCT